MRVFRVLSIMIAVALCGGLGIRCNNESSTAPEIPRNVILSEDFESDLSEYSQVTYMNGWSMMSLSTNAAHSGSQSLTTEANLSGIKQMLEPELQDSIAGLEFYLMAKTAGQTNIFAALALPGSSFNGLFVIMGMGIGMSDSLMYIFENSPVDKVNEHKNVAPLTLNKWYKCNVEYDFSTSTLTYFVDDDIIYSREVPNPGTLARFVVLRDDAGADGAKDYYLDDVTVYKR